MTVRQRSEQGFTLIELLVVIVILPLVVGAISVALISVLSQQTNVSNNVSNSQDVQTVTQNFVQDVQSASFITTDSIVTSPTTVCGAHAPILSLLLGSSSVVVSYDVIPVGSKSSLFRELCTSGGSTTATSARIVAYDVQGSLAPTVTGQSCSPTALTCTSLTSALLKTQWWPTPGVKQVQLSVTAPVPRGTALSYTLAGVPRVSTPLSRGYPSASGHPTAMSLSNSGDNVTCGGSSNASLTVNGTLQINSTSTTVASTNGNASISADQIDTSSTSSSALSGTVSPSSPTSTGVSVSDPYASMTPPATGLATATLTPGGTYQGWNVYAGGTYTSPQPGIYTGTLKVPNGTASLNGVYILMQGIALSGQQNLDSSTGVLLYVYGGTLDLSGNGTVTLGPFMTAPSTYAAAPNPWPGIVIWQDSVDTTALNLSGNGNGNVLSGTIYAPRASAETTGNGALTVGSLITAGLNCGGNGSFTIG